MSSKRSDASLEISPDGSVTLLTEGQRTCSAPLSDLIVSDRIGDISRTLRFPTGQIFETADNASIDTALAGSGLALLPRLIHVAESYWRVVLALFAGTAVALWWSVTYGLPVLAKHVALAVPVSITRALAGTELELLDRTLFAPTRLPEATQERLRTRFAAMREELTIADPSDLHFRRSTVVGANAFALPSGNVVLTDEIVELATTDDELVAVLAHELGHVVGRHALRRVLQNSTVALLTLALTNDAGSVSSAVATFPTLLVETHYSRELEREADDHALAYLQARGLDPAHLINLLERMEKGQSNEDALNFLSTHPSTAARAARFRGGAPATP